MPHADYKVASYEDLPEMLRAKFDLTDENTFRHKSTGAPVKTFPGNAEGHQYLRVYHAGKCKALAVHRAIWMHVTGVPIPPDFEIHHRDEDNQNNAWENLLCVHRLDHQKIHYQTEVPF